MVILGGAFSTHLLGKERWEVYGLSVDSGEVHYQAGAPPEIMVRLVQCWETCCTETGMFDPSHAFPHVQQ
jgi:hypothetical protein